nr:hypothetical protein [Brevundimonas diminuta]
MKTIQEKSVGEALVRLLDNGAGYTGAVFLNGVLKDRIDGQDPDEVFEAAVAASLRSAGGYVGYDGAIRRFLGIFPMGFGDPGYAVQERDYKLTVAERLNAGASLEACANASDAECAAAASAFSTNMLSRFENARARECLKGATGADYLRGAAAFARGEFAPGLKTMSQALKPYGNASWPLMTFLPYLWRPEEIMFLKPEATLKFAQSVGDAFPQHYRAGADLDTYQALERLADSAMQKIAELQPRDRIDVQSFIWVVGNY